MKTTTITTMTKSEIKRYRNNYSERGFWKKMGSCAVKAGKSVVRMALILYYELQDPNVTWEQKAVILGALGYLILPVDLIPDGIPVVGFTDDLAALKTAYEFIKSNISDQIRYKAEDKLLEWFD